MTGGEGVDLSSNGKALERCGEEGHREERSDAGGACCGKEDSGGNHRDDSEFGKI